MERTEKEMWKEQIFVLTVKDKEGTRTIFYILREADIQWTDWLISQLNPWTLINKKVDDRNRSITKCVEYFRTKYSLTYPILH